MAWDLNRNVAPRIFEALTDTRVVALQGARQVGKTTLVSQIVRQQSGVMVTLDDDTARASAQHDPQEFLRQAGDRLLAIDEVQRAPDLILALKLAVDADRRPGRFLITGSANLVQLPSVQDSLAGRAESIELFGFSQGELVSRRERFIDRVFSGSSLLDHRSDLTRADYLARACAGGYPEALQREGRRAHAWLDNYVERIIARDAADVSSLRRLSELPTILRLLAARNANELNMAGLAKDTHIAATTLGPYVDLLETLYLVQRIPAWSTNLSKKVVARPKIAILDTGLAARLTNTTPEAAGLDTSPVVAGQLLEGFVAGEIRRQLAWAEPDARMFHYRDHGGAEVDLILESGDGRIVGLEVKATSKVTSHDVRWLAQLRDKLGDRFAGGVVLHTGQRSLPMGERIAAVPLDALWA